MDVNVDESINDNDDIDASSNGHGHEQQSTRVDWLLKLEA